MAGQQRSSSGRPLARGAKRDALPALAGDPILERLDAQLTSGTAGQGMSTGGSDTPSKTCRRWRRSLSIDAPLLSAYSRDVGWETDRLGPPHRCEFPDFDDADSGRVWRWEECGARYELCFGTEQRDFKGDLRRTELPVGQAAGARAQRLIALSTGYARNDKKAP